VASSAVPRELDVRVRPRIRQDIGWVADLRLRLLDDLGATDPGQDLRLLRRSVCSFLERQHGLEGFYDPYA
jgi:hypothetical protein